MKLDVSVTSSPHLRQRETVSGVMLDVIIALVPAGIAGIYFFGLRALWVIAVSVLSCILFELIWNKLLKKPSTAGDLSAVVTGLLLAYNLPPTMPLWMVAIGALFAIIIVKQMFGGLGHNFMNPALAGRAFLLAAWATQMTKWTAPSIWGMDAVSQATPLALMKDGKWAEMPSMLNAFLGNIGGCIGETSAALLLLGGIYLMIRKVISCRTPVAFIGTVAVLTLIFGGGSSFQSAVNIMGYHLVTGGLFLGAIFMATDYTTSPVTAWGQVIMGVGCGIITTVIRLTGGYPEGVSYSILLMNIATPLIDKFTTPRVFGHLKKAKEA